jgi:hypothetical protein
MTEKRKSPSIRALEELHNILKTECCKVHGRMSRYGSVDIDCDFTDENKALIIKKSEIIKTISKEIEEYAIKKYTKYGLIVVPLCHRSSKEDGEDRLEIDLKVKTFPEAITEIEAKQKSDAACKRDMKAVDDWYFKALQAVALKEELPEVPQFSRI